MYYVMRASAPSLHRESTDSLIRVIKIQRKDETASKTTPTSV